MSRMGAVSGRDSINDSFAMRCDRVRQKCVRSATEISLLSHQHPRSLSKNVGKLSQVAFGDDQTRSRDGVL